MKQLPCARVSPCASSVRMVAVAGVASRAIAATDCSWLVVCATLPMGSASIASSQAMRGRRTGVQHGTWQRMAGWGRVDLIKRETILRISCNSSDKFDARGCTGWRAWNLRPSRSAGDHWPRGRKTSFMYATSWPRADLAGSRLRAAASGRLHYTAWPLHSGRARSRHQGNVNLPPAGTSDRGHSCMSARFP